ncbi:alpha/beta-hydrolase [Microthyrium microscopicum]|uniref:Alpha/beta-hydrolase n=1 Tax=Microthyrium microscopicum TaxID=703497 RepID=A0A6A6U5L8_9PEZI|nr:alpha/beta-hydrolase [Microthyrium microscopicum]
MRSFPLILLAGNGAALATSNHISSIAPLPELKLPYGTWQATAYDEDTDTYIFKNIRFAAPPVGQLRFAKPAPPLLIEGVQTGKIGNDCISTTGWAFGAGSLGNLVNSVIPGAEDCLFLDVFVPKRAFLEGAAAKLPGNKQQVYDGLAIVKQSNGSLIYVSGNYRLGALGFLGGKTAEENNMTNLGLWDQRAALEWTNKYISLVGGDPENVSCWGESAGAGSVMLHLTAFGGKQDPLFKRAVIASPFLEPRTDRNGILEANFRTFEAGAGCAGKGVACLRTASLRNLENGSNAVFKASPDRAFAFGPIPDGQWMRQLPALEFQSGNHWKNLESLIVSHVSNEADIFIPTSVTSNAKWQEYLTQWYPDQYSRMGGQHGVDVLATYIGTKTGLSAAQNADKAFPAFAKAYQSYLLSQAKTGDPNMYRLKSGPSPTIPLEKVSFLQPDEEVTVL